MNSCAASSTDIIPENKRGGDKGEDTNVMLAFFLFFITYTPTNQTQIKTYLEYLTALYNSMRSEAQFPQGETSGGTRTHNLVIRSHTRYPITPLRHISRE